MEGLGSLSGGRLRRRRAFRFTPTRDWSSEVTLFERPVGLERGRVNSRDVALGQPIPLLRLTAFVTLLGLEAVTVGSEARRSDGGISVGLPL